MNEVQRHFLPDRFRPRAPRRRSRRRVVLPLALVAAGLLVLPMWTVQSVEVNGGEVVPESVTASLDGLVGHMVPLLELDWLHQVAATWPAVSEVRVSLDLPGSVVVEIFPAPCRGSVSIGAGWHAVTADGRLAGAIDGPRSPQLVGFRRSSDRRTAFAVARRLTEGSGGRVTSIQMVTPGDYRVELEFGGPDRATTVHVNPEGTDAEKAWCDLVRDGRSAITWGSA